MSEDPWLDGWAVVNEHGFVCCTTDEGRSTHHVAVWRDRGRAEIFAVEMRRLNRTGSYTVRPTRLLLEKSPFLPEEQ